MNDQAADGGDYLVVSSGDNHDPTSDASWQRRSAFLKAFAAAQGDFQPIEKNRKVDFPAKDRDDRPGGGRVKFRYADLQEIHAKTRPALSANGLSTSTSLDHAGDQGVWITCRLAHADGYEKWSRVFIKYGQDMKLFGANVKYMRRYMLSALLEVDADDDIDEDGREIGEGDDGWSMPQETQRRRVEPTRHAPAAPTPAPRAAAPATPAATPAGDGPPGEELFEGDGGRPAAEPVASAAQVRTLTSKAKSVGVEPPEIAKRFNVEKLEQLTEAQFQESMQWLRSLNK